MPRRSYHHGDLRRALLEEAAARLRAGAPVTIRGVAAAVGVSPSATYRHVADLDELLDEVAAAWLDDLGHRLGEGLEVAATEDRLTAVARGYLAAAVEDPALFRLAAGEHGVGRPGGVRGAEEEGPAAQQRFLSAGPPDIAERVWIAVHGLAMLTIDGPYTPERAHELVAPLVAGLAGGPDAAEGRRRVRR